VPSAKRDKWALAISLSFIPGISALLEYYSLPAWRSLLSWRPWPGLFALIVGSLGAAMAMLNPASRSAKAAWIVAIFFFTALEIRSLKVASNVDDSRRQGQNEQFNKIASGIEIANRENQQRFEVTIRNSQQQFEATIKASHEQFEATSQANTVILGKTGRAADAAREAVATITGGDSWAYVEMIAGSSPRVVLPNLRVVGRYALRRVELRILDHRKYKEMLSADKSITISKLLASKFGTVRNFGDISPQNGIVLDETCGIDTNPDTDKNYDFEILALSGSWKEFLRFRKINGSWERAIRVVERNANMPNAEGKQLMEERSAGFPTVNGAIDWNN
jgi:hypothetical protein